MAESIKNQAELDYWKERHAAEGGDFLNAGYRPNMLRLIGEGEAYLDGKVIVDFGCGPRGSLKWADMARLRVGVDVNADLYADAFPESLLDHGMVYVKSTEQVIPIPAGFADVVVTMNAIDHVDDFEAMCGEIIRILKPGGLFTGYFNLEEPVSACEPQCLTEERVRQALLDRLEVLDYVTAVEGPRGGRYDPIHQPDAYPAYRRGELGILWARAVKP